MSIRDRLSLKRIAIGIIVSAVLIGIITPIVYFAATQKTEITPKSTPKPIAVPTPSLYQRIDCIPEEEGDIFPNSHDLCRKRGCIFKPEKNAPSCFFPVHEEHGFTALGSNVKTPFGFKTYLKRKGRSPFGKQSKDFLNPVFEMEMRGAHVVRFKLYDEGRSRYEVPMTLDLPNNQANPTEHKYEFEVYDRLNFAVRVKRRSTGKILFDTGVGGLTLTDKFLQLSTTLPSKNVYGFGENVHFSFKHDMNYTSWPMFGRDQPTSMRNQNYSNLYGTHPFYTCVEDHEGNTHGVLLLNSNAQDYSFTPLPMLTYRTIGGVLDFYIFLGPTPEMVVQQYTKAIGRPFMPPYWALGFQLSRYGYNNLTNMQNAVNRMKQNRIPLDVQYADIDHMDEEKDFTIDTTNFKELPEYFQMLSNNGMHTIIILDPCFITNNTNYEPYEKLKNVSGAIKWGNGYGDANNTDPTGALLGWVWPNGKVVFPDFFNKNTRTVWKELIVEHSKKLHFDALWIDMNEPANFDTNKERPWNWPPGDKPYWNLHCPNNEWDNPPYRTKAAFVHDDIKNSDITLLSSKTICMVATQGDRKEFRHYDVHNLYGWSQSAPTLQAVREATGKRSMVLSRSTFPGSGKYAGHWLGDNDSTWADMVHSIIGMLEFNLFGIPYIGADICGFMLDTTDELCTRWMQLGAFYPFSRNHNGIGRKEQDPGALGERVANASRDALETRYWLLPYLYTLFHHAHTEGSTVVRPLHHEFTRDPITLNVDKQFLWGRSLMISPILTKGQSMLTFYIPEGRWYNYYTNQYIDGPKNESVAVTLDTPIPLHVRGGSILPLQEPALNTTFSRRNPITIRVFLDKFDTDEGMAIGDIFWDDGDSIDSYEKGDYMFGKFKAQKNMLQYKVEGKLDVADEVMIDNIEIVGVNTSVMSIFLEEKEMQRLSYVYNDTAKMLKLSNLRFPLSEPFTLHWYASNFARIDCYPERLGGVDVVTEAKCRKRNCIYSPTESDDPDCFFPNGHYGYRQEGDPSTLNDTGLMVNLRWNDKSPFGKAVRDIVFKVEYLGDDSLRFSLDAKDQSSRYKVPIQLELPPPSKPRNPRYEVKITNTDPFHFQVIRRNSETVIWDTSVGGLTFEDQFLQIATKLPSTNIYGFGENVHARFKHDLRWKQWPMFSRDEGTGNQNAKNHYGVHPFYTCMEDDGQSHGVLLLNSNAQDYAFTPLPMLIYRTIGGIFDFYMFLGQEPENVIQQYTTLVGKPYMPPYWSLGFQLCRYGYNNIEKLKEAVERTSDAKIPHDVQYADIDHMVKSMDFTIDHNNFPGLNDYFQDLQSKGMKTIIILDPCLISNVTGYGPYNRMVQDGGSITWPTGYPIPKGSSNKKGELLGYVWPQGKVVFPDFFLNSTQEVWKELIRNHHENISFDGLWIDMNEPANFGTNLEKPWNWPDDSKPYWSLHCNLSDTIESPPYRTMAAFVYDENGRVAQLSDKTVCLVSRQGINQTYKHYDVHSLYGWSQTKPTLDGLRLAVPGKRGIVISRSTYPGSGKYAGHWLGDNSAIWEDVHLSIIGMLEFNLFGIPYIGADICGFFGDSNPELCLRWMQLGAFYTFSRNHNGINYVEQDPAAFGEAVANASRDALTTRYELLPYLYTLFHHAHIRGGTVIRPLHHEFPKDRYTYGVDRQFMWGKAVMFSPILEEGQTSLNLYLPPSIWYDYYTGSMISETGRENKLLSIQSSSKIPIHIRGGNIIPVQRADINTVKSRKNVFTLKIALENDGRRYMGNGDLFWDDGESIDTFENSNYYYSVFIFLDDKLKMMVQHANDSSIESLKIDKVQILGSNLQFKYAYINETTKKEVFKVGNLFEIRNLQISLMYDFEINFMEFMKPDVGQASRIDCFPDHNKLSETECIKRGCTWRKSTISKLPTCFIDNTKHGYSMHNETKTSIKTIIDLRWKNQSTLFSGDIPKIFLEIYELSENILQLKFLDPKKARYEVPITLNKINATSFVKPKYNVTYKNDINNMFVIKIYRVDTGEVIWDTSIGGFTFADQFLQLATKLPSKNVYGIGENRHFTFQHNMNFKRWPLFSRDNGVNWGDYANLYGVHPFYMCVEDKNGNSHAVLLLNSNAMEIMMQPLPALTYRTIGGILDFYFFLGPSPEDVIQQYTSLIGRPYLPPYWALGFQLSRYGYNNIENMMAAVNRTIDSGIPYDVQYADIDHMDERKDFTVDQTNFNGLKEYVVKLQSMKKHFIIILDPALVSNTSGYIPYDEGIRENVFIKWPNQSINPDYSTYNKSDMLGYVWPKGKVVFPDFFHNGTRKYWINLIEKHHQNISFDGLWIDMNEPANFGTNEERPFNWPVDAKPYWSLKCPISPLDDPPYKPQGVYGARLSDKTLCMIGQQGNGKYDHYDVHSLYGWSETEPTLAGLRKATGKRGIVISRSTYPSSGKFTGHWLGDNDSGWKDMHDSVIGIMEFNLFGIPYIGADICGFFGDSTPELCERWMQLGAFYTFSRNHNTIGTKDQDPGYFGKAIAYSSRQALETRYTLLPYLYTLFYHAHVKGSTVIRSMLQNFPGDAKTWDIDYQFMWGSGILIIPVLQAGKREVLGYFPNTQWFDFRTGKQILNTGRHHILSAPRDHIPLFVRGGNIIPVQHSATTTTQSRQNPFGLIIAPDANGTATGDLFWDDGDSIDTISNNSYYFSEFHMSPDKITLDVTYNSTMSINGLTLSYITVYGMQRVPSAMILSTTNKTLKFNYNVMTSVLNITDINAKMNIKMHITIS